MPLSDFEYLISLVDLRITGKLLWIFSGENPKILQTLQVASSRYTLNQLENSNFLKIFQLQKY